MQFKLKVVTHWFRNKKLIVNPKKFQAVILDKQEHNYSHENIKFDNNATETVSSVILLGVKLNLNLHVSKICKSAANQLCSFIRFNNFLCFEGKIVLINSYFMSKFNYCPLVWMFSNANCFKKIENIKKTSIEISVQ